jgi:hypothetical protein
MFLKLRLQAAYLLNDGFNVALAVSSRGGYILNLIERAGQKIP